jgi:hypothetical protein
MCRPFDYTMTDSDFAETSYFAKEIYNTRKDSASTVVYAYANTDTFINNSSFFNTLNIGFTSNVGGTTYNNPMYNFYSVKTLTSAQYFNGLYDNATNIWSNLK